MEIIANPSQVEIKKAAQTLREGHLVAFPTETVYGLGADANNSKAVARIYEVKGRPTDHPLIVHISSINQLDKWVVDIPDYAIKLAKEFWPGPMTLILKRNDLASDFITGGQENIGLRVPDQWVALALLSEFEKLGGTGIAAPSANRFGAVSPTTADAVVEELGNFLHMNDSILNGGQCAVGIESTIIDCTKSSAIVLRPGAVTAEMIEKITEHNLSEASMNNKIKASGLLDSHYSPKAKIVLDVPPAQGDGLIAISNIPTPNGVIRLMAPKDEFEYAQNLYLALRSGDLIGIEKISVYLPKGMGISLAIRDRLTKAAK
jgi:L-threonylcarbamoyladenylate synthase